MSEQTCPCCGAPAERIAHPIAGGALFPGAWRFDAEAVNRDGMAAFDRAEFAELLKEVVALREWKAAHEAAAFREAERALPRERDRLEKAVTLALNAFNAPRDDDGDWDCELRDAMVELETAYLTANLNGVRAVDAGEGNREDAPPAIPDWVLNPFCNLVEFLTPLLDNAEGYDKSNVRAAFLALNNRGVVDLARREELLGYEEAARIAWKAALKVLSQVRGSHNE